MRAGAGSGVGWVYIQPADLRACHATCFPALAAGVCADISTNWILRALPAGDEFANRAVVQCKRQNAPSVSDGSVHGELWTEQK